jgi:hypothetical protein
VPGAGGTWYVVAPVVGGVWLLSAGYIDWVLAAVLGPAIASANDQWRDVQPVVVFKKIK